MKKLMLMGKQSAGKTTFFQKLSGAELSYDKTQQIEMINSTMIDTPGEYLEQRAYHKALVVTAIEADVIGFVIDAKEENSMFAPGLATMFTKPCIGIITQADTATEKQIRRATQFLEFTDVPKIFITSSVTGDGIDDVMNYLTDNEITE